MVCNETKMTTIPSSNPPPYLWLCPYSASPPFTMEELSVSLQCLSWIISFLCVLKDFVLHNYSFSVFNIKFPFSAESFQVTDKCKTFSYLYPFLVTAPFLTSPVSLAPLVEIKFPPLHWNGSCQGCHQFTLWQIQGSSMSSFLLLLYF